MKFAQIAHLWAAGLIGLGAVYLVSRNPGAVATGIGAAQRFTSGTLATATGR